MVLISNYKIQTRVGVIFFSTCFLLSDIKIWLRSSLKASFYCRKPPGGDCVWRQTCRVNKANKLNCAVPLLMCTTFDSFRGHNKTSSVNNHTTIQVLAPPSGTFSFLCPRKHAEVQRRAKHAACCRAIEHFGEKQSWQEAPLESKRQNGKENVEMGRKEGREGPLNCCGELEAGDDAAAASRRG